MEEIIKKYLEERAKTDMSVALNLQKKNKSIKDCCAYIEKQALKKAKGTSKMKAAHIADDVVFGWAVHYYDEDNLEKEEKQKETKNKAADKPTKVVTMKPTTTTTKTADKPQNEAKKPAKVVQLDLF